MISGDDGNDHLNDDEGDDVDGKADAEPGGKPVFGGDGDEDDDTMIEPSSLMARMLRILLSNDQVVGEAVGLEGLNIPAADSMGRGKCCKVTTKQYEGYLGH